MKLSPLLSSAVASVSWPLGPSSSPPLLFKSLEEMEAERGKPIEFLTDNLISTIETMFPRSTNNKSPDERRHFGIISMAILLIGHGYTDECHNLITPLSWPDDVHFAYGPSEFSRVSNAAKAYATYAHCLVHRREAFHIGEFGMMGFQNANFWSSSVYKMEEAELHLPHAELLSKVRHLVRAYPNHGPIQKWCKNHQLMEETWFESRAVHELCATVLRDNKANKDPILQEFAERVVQAELETLLEGALQRAGLGLTSMVGDNYQESAANSSPPPNSCVIDDDIALSAARRVSAAHLSHFETNGSIVLRRLNDDDETVESSTVDTTRLSVAAGVACRLLKSPACCLVDTNNAGENVRRLRIDIRCADDTMRDDGLQVGDLLASVVDGRADKDACGAACFDFVPCAADDTQSTFVDRLFGASGETPTTVVQWSKGTIF